MLKDMTGKLTDYFKKNAVGIVILDALLLIVWGRWLINTNPRIDTSLYYDGVGNNGQARRTADGVCVWATLV